jgi:ArsR family transcriptional regulator
MQSQLIVTHRTEEDIIRRNRIHINRANFLMKTVCNPFRQSILSLLLCHDAVAVLELCEKMQIPQSAMSQHLSFLRKAQLVKTRRVGKQIFYSINEEQLNQVIEFIRQVVPVEELKNSL